MDPPNTLDDEKLKKNVYKLFLIAQKKRLDAPNASQKTSARGMVSEKIKKNLKK